GLKHVSPIEPKMLCDRESEGRTVAEVALELGVGSETFRKWVRQGEADRGERPDGLPRVRWRSCAGCGGRTRSCVGPTRSSSWPPVFSPRSCAPRGAMWIEGR